MSQDAIILQGVKTHNLKNLDLILPHRRLYVVTGVSGSGKSSLAFDTLYAEGQRRYVESLSAYARQFLERMEKPDADAVAGIPPAIAIEAKNTVNNARSTVGTQTEINDYLRVLFARMGQTFCPECKTEVKASRPETAAEFLLSKHDGKNALVLYRVPFSEKAASHLKEFLPELERQGFTEFFQDGKIVSAEEILKNKKIKILQVVVDRPAALDKNKKRLVDSLELAFRYGKGEAQIFVENKMLEFSEALSCFTCGKTFREPTPNLFSFNSPLGACPVCQGFGRVITVDWDLVIPDPRKTLAEGAIEPWTKPSSEWEAKRLVSFCKREKIPMDVPWKNLSAKHRGWILEGHPDKPYKNEGDYFSVKEFFKYLEKKTYKMHVRIFLAKYRCFEPCTACAETRLKPEALWVSVRGKNVHELQVMSLEELVAWIDALKLNSNEKEKAEPVYLEIQRRVRFLNDVGLGYLSLARLSRTLSGGEVQRIHLATSLGSALVDTLYVLDEPSVGLHERDNYLLINLLHRLRDLGNTVVVVEHDKAMIEAADEILDMGPGGGENGGKVLFQGNVADLKNKANTLTGEYLSGKRKVSRRQETSTGKKPAIKIHKAAEHNLKDVSVTIPLKSFTVITGVSGSGKSTLMYDVLHKHFLRHQGKPVQDLGKVQKIEGFENIDDVVLVDQSPIGRTPRSNPATYLNAYDEIRKIFAGTAQAKREGFEPGHFSFNVDGGRCPACKGDGRIKVEMHFLADVYMTCEQCQGKRFKPEILEVTYNGHNVDDVLAMTIDDAKEFFKANRKLYEIFQILQKVGLGYLRLGQSAVTLSGGEAQRMKLAYEMSETKGGNLLYLFDEPTTGLHYHDIHYLMTAFDELLARGHSLVIIEHHMEIIRAADYVVDLGPEGGGKGGELIYQGDLAGLMKSSKSFTGKYLAKHLREFSEPVPAH